MSERSKAYSVLVMNTLAFTVCFACWMVNGVLVTFLMEHQVYRWTDTQIGLLIGIPVLTGSLLRLPVGILTDRYGGRVVFAGLMLASAVGMFTLSLARDFASFLAASLMFGIVGASFAVGIAYTSVWFPQSKQGTALGIFGTGNAGAAVTSMLAPLLLAELTGGGENPEAWRKLPLLYAAALVGMAVLFYLFTYPKQVEEARMRTMSERLAPLREVRVWRFGLYYFLVFGGFVALSQWLIPYYVSVYVLPLATAGMMAAIFSLPSGVIRALGGWISDHWGARRVMYWVLGGCLVGSLLLIFPRMDVQSPGRAVLAKRAGTVTEVRVDAVVVDDRTYPIRPRTDGHTDLFERAGTLILPTFESWQQPVVSPGDQVRRRQPLARGITHIFFQANVWVFTGLVFIVGFLMGIGKAAVYKHIPTYFPRDVGVVGGVVGVLGGLGGFICPIIFGYLLDLTGIWTTCWMLFALLSGICLYWMHTVIQRMIREQAPTMATRLEPIPVEIEGDGRRRHPTAVPAPRLVTENSNV